MNEPWIITLIAAALSALLGGGIVAIRKAKPEVRDITIQSADRVVVMQDRYITRLEDRLTSLEGSERSNKERFAFLQSELEGYRDEVEHLKALLKQVQSEKAALEQENARLRERVLILEQEVAGLNDRKEGGQRWTDPPEIDTQRS